MTTNHNTDYRRYGNRWTVNELLNLQREYELLQLPLAEIASRHQRTVMAIMYKLDQENLADFNDLYEQTFGVKRSDTLVNLAETYNSCESDNDDSQEDDDDSSSDCSSISESESDDESLQPVKKQSNSRTVILDSASEVSQASSWVEERIGALDSRMDTMQKQLQSILGLLTKKRE
jgi:hypothetical protein